MTQTSARPHLGANTGGFTLVEFLISTVIGTAIMGTMIVVTGQLQQAYYSQLDGAAVQQEARFALDWISRTLVSAGSNPSAIGIGGCPTAGTVFIPIQRDPNNDNVQNDIRIQADLNPPNGLLGGPGGAGGCGEAREDITIAHDAANKTVTRRDNNIDNAPVPMSDRVITQLAFAYLDRNRVPTALDAQVAFVQVTVTAQTPVADKYTGQPLSYTHTDEVRVRTR